MPLFLDLLVRCTLDPVDLSGEIETRGLMDESSDSFEEDQTATVVVVVAAKLGVDDSRLNAAGRLSSVNVLPVPEVRDGGMASSLR